MIAGPAGPLPRGANPPQGGLSVGSLCLFERTLSQVMSGLSFTRYFVSNGRIHGIQQDYSIPIMLNLHLLGEVKIRAIANLVIKYQPPLGIDSFQSFLVALSRFLINA